MFNRNKWTGRSNRTRRQIRGANIKPGRFNRPMAPIALTHRQRAPAEHIGRRTRSRQAHIGPKLGTGRMFKNTAPSTHMDDRQTRQLLFTLRPERLVMIAAPHTAGRMRNNRHPAVEGPHISRQVEALDPRHRPIGRPATHAQRRDRHGRKCDGICLSRAFKRLADSRLSMSRKSAVVMISGQSNRSSQRLRTSRQWASCQCAGS